MHCLRRLLEDNRLSGLSDEVTAVKEIIAANDDLSKLMIIRRLIKKKRSESSKKYLGEEFQRSWWAYENDYRKESLQRAYLSFRLLS